MNSVQLIGRIGADPELKTTNNGKSVVNFSVATNRVSKGEKVTDWHNCVAFEKTADVVAKYLKKGSQVGLEGTVTYDKWEDKDGNKRTSTKIVTNRVHFVGAKPETDEDPGF